MHRIDQHGNSLTRQLGTVSKGSKRDARASLANNFDATFSPATSAAAAVAAEATPTKSSRGSAFAGGVSALEAATLEIQVFQRLFSRSFHHQYAMLLIPFSHVQRTNVSPIRARLLKTRKRSTSSML